MSVSPFEKDSCQYFVLVNDRGQHSLWPQQVAVPAGWHVVHGAADRDSCLRYVESHWTDLRPLPAAAPTTVADA